MNRFIALLAVVLFWIFLPVIIIGLTVALFVAMVYAGNQVVYAYILNQLNER
jgi:ABC-type transport system involved in multi-copper enzyme maturation permease subunit